MSKIYPTQPNLDFGHKLDIVKDVNKYKNENPNIQIMKNSDITITYDYINNTVLLFDNKIFLTPNNTSNKTVFFGEDTLNFAKFLENLFGLKSTLTGVTDVAVSNIKFEIKLSRPVNYNVTISLPTDTTQWIAFDSDGSSATSSMTLFSTPMISGTIATLTPIARYADGVLNRVFLRKNF